MNIIQIDRNCGKTPSEILAEAMDFHAAGELEAAETAYVAVISRGYRVIDVLPLLAGISSANGDFEIALERWTQLLELQPSHLFGLMQKAALLHRLGRWTDAVRHLEMAEQIDPFNPATLLNLGVALLDAGRGHEAATVLRRLADIQPGNPLVEHQIRRVSSALVPFWHIPMLNDQARNDAFEKAIQQAISAHGSDASVLDIGAGSGLLSMMAIRAGARSVVCCESVEIIAEMTKRIVSINGYEDQIRVISKNSKELVVGEDLDKRADVLVSEILSCDLLSESVLNTFEDAIDRLVHEDAVIIPRSITAMGCLIESDVLAKYAFVDRVSGFDVSPFTELASTRLPVHGKLTSWRRLSEDHDLIQIDLRARRHEGTYQKLSLPVTADGTAVGIMQWIRVDVAEGVEFSNPPDDYSDGGWLQVVHTFSHPVVVRAGDEFELLAGHDRTSLILMPAHK
ncbi:MAG: tetratricopeptide repeat protein [Proteobacteria bacterium]|nr:tetratricopeptide repeat protein [Pseudomonadota bacterium]